MIDSPALHRRGFITGLGALFIFAPAIVKATNIMPVRALAARDWLTLDECAARIMGLMIDKLQQQVADAVMYGSTGAGNLLGVSQITRESVRLWKDSNASLQHIDHQYDEAFAQTQSKLGTQLHQVAKGFHRARSTSI
jgi:hypothetical protein